MNAKSVMYLVVGPLAYRFTSDCPMVCDKTYAHFFQNEPPTQKQGVRMVIDCEVMVADQEIMIDGELVFHDPVRSVYNSSQGLETRVLNFEGKPYAICRETLQVKLQLILAKFCLSEGNVLLSSDFLESLMMERFMIMCGGMILHSSFIVHNDKAILFTAPSGTGKSTQASLWERYSGAEIINGDRSVVWYDDTQHRFMASGLPFCGSSGINKIRTVQLCCIVFISQAPENNAQLMPVAVAARKLFGEMSINKWNVAFVEKALDLIDRLVTTVPMVRLECNMEEGAVQTLRRCIDEMADNNE